MTRGGHRIDVDRTGLPTDSEISLEIHSGGTVHGRYILVASTTVAGPTLEQRQVAATLAGQVDTALAVPEAT